MKTKTESKKIAVPVSWMGGFLVGLMMISNGQAAELQLPQSAETLRSAPETSVAEISQTNPEGMVPQNELNSINHLMLEKSIRPLMEIPTDEEGQKRKASFADLKFSPYLIQKGEIKISEHESILFEEGGLVARSFGNQVALNFGNQKLMSVTYVGYVLGPFGPDQDYLDVYFQTLDSIQKLFDKLSQKEENKELTGHILNATKTFKEFYSRALKIKDQAAVDQQKMQAEDAIRDFYHGKLPAYEKIEIETGKNSETLKAELWFEEEGQKKGIAQKRSVELQKIREEWKVKQAEDVDSFGTVLLKEEISYDVSGKIAQKKTLSYHSNGEMKMDSTIKYQQGIRQRRIYAEFDPTGLKIRHVNETFYDEGSIKTSSDYHYQSGKRYLFQYDPSGKMTASSSQPLPNGRPLAA